jgi:hypothetical protein
MAKGGRVWPCWRRQSPLVPEHSEISSPRRAGWFRGKRLWRRGLIFHIMRMANLLLKEAHEAPGYPQVLWPLSPNSTWIQPRSLVRRGFTRGRLHRHSDRSFRGSITTCEQHHRAVTSDARSGPVGRSGWPANARRPSCGSLRRELDTRVLTISA